MEATSEKPLSPMDRFFEFWERIKGKRDVKSRASVMSDPDNLKTMSVLTRGQAEFVAISHWVARVPEWMRMWKGLEEYALLFCATSISVGGRGREDTIKFMGALSESKLLSKLGINLKGEDKQK